MATPLLPQLEQMLEATKQGKIPWKSSNQNMTRWNRLTKGRNYIVTLQTQSRLGGGKNYMFNIQTSAPVEVIVQLNTTVDVAYENVLSRLFEAAMTASKDGGSKVIDDLLSGL